MTISLKGRYPRRPHHPRRTLPRGAQARDQALGRFRPGIGEKTVSAQITRHYTPEALVGRQVLAVVNFPPRQIGKVMSEVLVLGVPDAEGEVVLIGPDQDVPDGRKDVLMTLL
jgi:hypothetical protein